MVEELDVNDNDAVFRVFDECAEALGGLDRIVVNAGLGKGASIGKGYFEANRQTAMTNVVGALAQCEAAMQQFRAANAGQLVVVSSVSSRRGCRGAMTTYAAQGLRCLPRRGDPLRCDRHADQGHDGLSRLRQREEGLPSLLRGLATADRRHIPRSHQPVLTDGRTVGEVTSGTFSPLLGHGIALAYTSPADAFELGAAVEIDIRGRRAPATVVATPFVDRSPR